LSLRFTLLEFKRKGHAPRKRERHGQGKALIADLAWVFNLPCALEIREPSGQIFILHAQRERNLGSDLGGLVGINEVPRHAAKWHGLDNELVSVLVVASRPFC